MTIAFKPLTKEEVKFSIRMEQSDIPVRGNAMVSGDDAADKECEDEIIDRLNAGDNWAWCDVCVIAEWEGFRVEEYLGSCSYEGEADFKDGYYEDMCERALAELNADVKATFEKLASRIEEI